jgi:two-component system LytT family sensor kinase
MNIPRISTLGLATIILWALGYTMWLTNFVFEPMPYQLDHSLRGIAVFTLGAMLSLGIGRMLNGLQERADAKILTGVVILSVIVATALLVSFDVLVMRIIAPRWGDPSWTSVLEQIPMAWVFVAWMLLYFALVADATRRDREIRLAQATTTAIDAQHRLLVQQINPHFLFNALNTVYALVVDGDGARAQRCLLALSAFLRGSIDHDAPRNVPLSNELASIRHYLEIELTRFGERLHLHESIPPGLLERSVPALILQPLVENCIKHGLTGHAGAMTIWLSASLEQEELVLSVEDDGRSPPQDGAWSFGVGLNNVRQRLQVLYGDAARLTADARSGGGFVSRVHLPAA